MDTNPDSPWNLRVPTSITPVEFEKLVLTWLNRCTERQNWRFKVTHLGLVEGSGGGYQIDILVEFTLFGGATFIILVECKHQTRPLEREDVMVLQAKLQDVAAHKGILFSTSGYQSGAIRYAAEYGVATVTVVHGTWLYETRSAGTAPAKPPPWSRFDTYAGIRISPTEKGFSCHTIEVQRIDALVEWLSSASSA